MGKVDFFLLHKNDLFYKKKDSSWNIIININMILRKSTIGYMQPVGHILPMTGLRDHLYVIFTTNMFFSIVE